MTILGIGVDVVHLPRIVTLIRNRGAERFASRILSSQEVSDWKALPPHATETTRARFLGVRWSVKEATYKAMYPAGRPSWKELTYCYDGASPKPSLLYQPHNPRNSAMVGNTHVSISHDGDYIVASVVLEAPEKGH